MTPNVDSDVFITNLVCTDMSNNVDVKCVQIWRQLLIVMYVSQIQCVQI